MEPQTPNEQTESGEAEGTTEPINSEETIQSEDEAKEGGDTQPSDVSEHRLFGILGYILPFLFFLPLLNEKTKNVPFARFHANQQLILLIVVLGIYFLQGFIFMIFMAAGLFLMQLVNMAIFVLAVIGAWHAYNGEMKELPFIGKFRILK